MHVSSKKCEKENMIRDKIVFSIAPQEKVMKKRLLCRDNLTWEKTREICIAFEVTKNEVRSMGAGQDQLFKTVDQVRRKQRIGRPQRSFSAQNRSGHSEHQSSYQNESSIRKTGGTKQYDCRRCGTRHEFRKCPAYGTLKY